MCIYILWATTKAICDKNINPDIDVYVDVVSTLLLTVQHLLYVYKVKMCIWSIFIFIVVF